MLIGNLQDALDAYQQSLAIAKRFAAEDECDTAWQHLLIVSLYNVGTTTAKIKAPDSLSQAQEFLLTALNLAEKFLGPDKQQLIDSLNRVLQSL